MSETPLSEEDSVLRRMANQASGLPPSMGALTPLWQKVADEAAQALSSLLGVEMEAEPVGLSTTDSLGFVNDHPDPGLLIALRAVGDDGYHARMSAADTLWLTTLLLKAWDAAEGGGGDLSILDGLLLRGAINAVLTPIGQAFGADIECIEDEEPLFEWPLAPPDPVRALLVARFVFRTDGEQKITLDVSLPTSHPAFARADNEETDPSAALLETMSVLPVEVFAILDQWTTSPSAVKALQPGETLSLKGASLDNLSLAVSNRGRPAILAHGEHGRSGGRQALRVTAVEGGIAS